MASLVDFSQTMGQQAAETTRGLAGLAEQRRLMDYQAQQMNMQRLEQQNLATYRAAEIENRKMQLAKEMMQMDITQRKNRFDNAATAHKALGTADTFNEFVDAGRDVGMNFPESMKTAYPLFKDQVDKAMSVYSDEKQPADVRAAALKTAMSTLMQHPEVGGEVKQKMLGDFVALEKAQIGLTGRMETPDTKKYRGMTGDTRPLDNSGFNQDFSKWLADQQQNTEAMRIRVSSARASNRVLAALDSETGKTVFVKAEEAANNPNRYTAPQYSPELKGKLHAAITDTGAAAANVWSANQVFQKAAPELIELRNKVGQLPGWLGNIKSLEELKQWSAKATGDDDTTLLVKKVTFMADALQKTIGGAQGGQWAFETAKSILDPTLTPKNFANVMAAHSDTLYDYAMARRNAFNEPLEGPVTSTGKKKEVAEKPAAGEVAKKAGPVEGATGTYEGKPVIFKGGKWVLK